MNLKKFICVRKMTTTLTIPEFDDIKVSTKTFIVMTNVVFNLKKIFNILPITDFVVVQKRRGRKRKGVVINPNIDIPKGSIISLKHGNETRGVSIKKVKNGVAQNKIVFFRNSLSIVMTLGIVDDDIKKVNFKICENGKFQMTGCKYDSQAEEVVLRFWNYIKDNKELYTLKDSTPFTATFIPAMRNIDFNIGIKIDREKFDNFFNQLHYHSLLETSIGYTGVNVKIPVKEPIKELKLKQLVYDNETCDWFNSKTVLYQEYLNTMTEKEQLKKITKDRYNTFLVFHSGKIIMSSMCADFAKPTYEKFINIIKENYSLFQEQLEEF